MNNIPNHNCKDVPRDTVLEFVMNDGSKLIGTITPYWCGSDCPCGMIDYDTKQLAEPECWTVKTVDGKISELNPVVWEYVKE